MRYDESVGVEKLKDLHRRLLFFLNRGIPNPQISSTRAPRKRFGSRAGTTRLGSSNSWPCWMKRRLRLAENLVILMVAHKARSCRPSRILTFFSPSRFCSVAVEEAEHRMLQWTCAGIIVRPAAVSSV